MLIYFITCTTRGTWLHGNPKGSYDKNGRYIQSDNQLQEYNEQKMNHQPFLLTSDMQSIIRIAVKAFCEKNGWFIHAFSVQSNHFHLAVAASEINVKCLVARLKSNLTMRLRKVNLIDSDCHPWTRLFNSVSITTDKELERVCKYINNQ